MRTSVMALIGIVMAIFVLVGVYVAVDGVWSDGSDEVESSGSFFTECINEVLTDEETECGLFGNEESNGG